MQIQCSRMALKLSQSKGKIIFALAIFNLRLQTAKSYTKLQRTLWKILKIPMRWKGNISQANNSGTSYQQGLFLAVLLLPCKNRQVAAMSKHQWN